MMVHIKYFASIREAIGLSMETLETEAPTLAALREALIARGGAYADSLAHGRALRMALNQVMSPESAQLSEGAEVAFFPPVTGG
jgi:molybdopterin synthase sulfur carrier subunit